LRVACATLVLTVLAAPAALGPAAGVLLRDFGAALEVHVCKCGMPVGKCGCPECDRLENERRSEHSSERVPTLKRHCNDDAPLLPSGAFPAGVLASVATAELPLPLSERLAFKTTTASWVSRFGEPPTPPPRLARV
jgi:hypothetical protein